jgi:hypothetical protein
LIETSLKTLFLSRESISLRRDSSNGNLRAVITPLARSSITSYRSRFSFSVKNTLIRNESVETIATSYSIALTEWIIYSFGLIRIAGISIINLFLSTGVWGLVLSTGGWSPYAYNNEGFFELSLLKVGRIKAGI